MFKRLPFGLLCLLLSLTVKAQPSETEDQNTFPGKRYGNNIISVIPVSLNNTGRGAGLCYERFLDEKGKLSLYIPLLLSFKGSAWHYRDQYKSRSAGGLIGFKFYPTSSRGIVRYAMGLSLATYVITRTYERAWSPMGFYDNPKKENYTQTGLLFNNSVNFTLSGKVSIGIDLHLGVSDSSEPDFDSTEPFVLLLFKGGYRF